MKNTEDNIGRILEAVRYHRVSPSSAITRALGFRRTRDYAEAIGRKRAEVGMCLNGVASRIYPDIRDDVASRLGVTRERLDALILELELLWDGR